MSEKPKFLASSEIEEKLATDYPYESIIDSASLRSLEIDLMHYSFSDLVEEEDRSIIYSYKKAIEDVYPDLFAKTIRDVRKEMGELTNHINEAQQTGINLELLEHMQFSLMELRSAFPEAIPIRTVNQVIVK